MDQGLGTREQNKALAPEEARIGMQDYPRLGTSLGTRLGAKDQGLETRKRLFQAEHFRLKPGYKFFEANFNDIYLIKLNSVSMVSCAFKDV